MLHTVVLFRRVGTQGRISLSIGQKVGTIVPARFRYVTQRVVEEVKEGDWDVCQLKS